MAAASKGCQGLQKRRIGKGGEKVKEKKLQWERRLGGGGGGVKYEKQPTSKL